MHIVRTLAVSILLLLPQVLHATTYIVPPDEWMIDDASAIVTGTVTDAYPRFTARGEIETVFVLALDEVLKGTLSASRVEVVEWGGRIGERWTLVPGAPRYELGKRYLIFMIKNRNREWSTQHMTLGRFEFASAIVEKILVRESSEIHGWDIDGKEPVERHRYSDRFLTFIRNRTMGYATDARYYVEEGRDLDHSRRTRALSERREIAPNFADYDFDDAASVGVNAWKNDTGSNVAYSISGTPASNSTKNETDSEDKIIEEDPGNAYIAGTFSGAGVVATAFMSGAGTHTVDGKSYITITGADVVTQNGVKASSLGQNRFRTVMVHEIGHTLGFRHSNRTADGKSGCVAPLPCSSSAVMNSSASDLNGQLQSWDIDAVRAAYGSVGDASDYTMKFCGDAQCTIFTDETGRRTSTSVGFRLAEEECVPPSIATQPQNKTITPPATSTSLSVTATGSGPLTYQWFSGNSGDTSTPSIGTTNPITVSPTATASYWVRVTGQCDPRTVDSNAATVTVAPCAPPQISSFSSDRTISEGTATQLTVTATGTATLHYQWYIGPPGNTTQPTGSDNKNLTVSPRVTTAYWVRVSGACAPTADSGAILVTVVACPDVSIGIPTSTPSGSNMILSIEATSTAVGSLSYAWFLGNTPGVGGTQVGGTKSISVAVTAEVKNYWVRVSNTCNRSVVSSLVSVASCTLPGIATQPADQTIQSGGNATLSLALTGDGLGVTVTWYRGNAPDKTNQVGTGNSVNVGPLTTTTSYWAAVLNSCGEVSTRTAIITISECTAPAVTSSPASQEVKKNTSVTLTVVATGTAALQYQWYEGAKGDTTKPLPGAIFSTFTSANLFDSTSFWVRVSNTCGTADSDAAQIEVSNGRRRAVRK